MGLNTERDILYDPSLDERYEEWSKQHHGSSSEEDDIVLSGKRQMRFYVVQVVLLPSAMSAESACEGDSSLVESQRVSFPTCSETTRRAGPTPLSPERYITATWWAFVRFKRRSPKETSRNRSRLVTLSSAAFAETKWVSRRAICTI